jgi:hypothetical protein
MAEIATATAGWVSSILGRVQGGVVDGRHHGGFGLSGGAVGFSFAHMILHVLSFYEHTVARPGLGEILYT